MQYPRPSLHRRGLSAAARQSDDDRGVDAAGLCPFERFTAEAESSRKPGAAETLGAGAAASRGAQSPATTVGTGAVMKGDVEADAERTAKATVRQLAQFFAAQGWTAAAPR